LKYVSAKVRNKVKSEKGKVKNLLPQGYFSLIICIFAAKKQSI